MRRRKSGSFLLVKSKNIFYSSVPEEIIENELVVVMLLECDPIKFNFTLLVITSECSSCMISLSCKHANVRSVIATLNKAHLIVHSSYLPDLQHGHWIELNLKILVFSS